MADIICPNCKRENPDFLDVCQFCQTPLKPEPMVHTGEKPTKKNTGELEAVLPDWLRDARQQARDLAEEDAAQAATQPKIQKVEPPDLLAGLAFQAHSSEEDEVPDWLSSISPMAKATPASSKPEATTDFFAQFNKSEPAARQEPPEDHSASEINQAPTSSEKDDLSAWFTQASEQSADTFSFEPDTTSIDSGWSPIPDAQSSSAQPPAPKEEEDLSWLHNLEASAKQTDELKAPRSDSGWMAPAQAGQEDLSWLNNLGGVPAPETKQPSDAQDDLSWLNSLGGTPISSQPVSSQPAAPQEDLSWLNDLGEAALPAQPAASQPSAPSDDLSWLNNLGGTAEPAQPVGREPSETQADLSWLSDLAGTSAPDQPSSQPAQANDDLSWLGTSGGPSEPVQPATSQANDDLGWLNKFASTPEAEPAPASTDFSWLNEFPQNAADTGLPGLTLESEQPFDELAETPQEPLYSPSQTAPLTPDAGLNSMPDWLRDATQTPSMPLSMETLDQFRDDRNIKPAHEEPFSWKNFTLESKPSEEEPLTSRSSTPSDNSDIFSLPVDSTPISSQDVDSLFSMDMPDWLSQEPAKEEFPSQQPSVDSEDAGALAPVDLPSWVQAMRPMDAAISDTAVHINDQPAEREGPLAGLRGVIPIAPIGSSQRPKAISLKLQASSEQQAGATLLEQLLANETAPRAIPATKGVTSQAMLRRILGLLVLLVLGTVLVLRSQMMPISSAVPAAADAVATTLALIPDNSQVLLVLDYEPALAGELEASSGPVLTQLVSRHPTFSFVSMSSNGPALVERLMTNTRINQPAPNGAGFVAGTNYVSLGYLPGGDSGVLAFVQSPQKTIPASTVATLSGYSAVIVLTDHAESARVWVEQIQNARRADIMLTNQPLLVVASAQAGPLLQPYVSSGQVTGLISGFAEAARYEAKNGISLGTTRSYWDAFSIGLTLAIVLIVAGGLWSLITGLRARRAEAEQG